MDAPAKSSRTATADHGAARTSTPRSPDEVVRTMRDGPHQTFAVGDERIAYWRFGRGPDLVLVHGWPVHAATFRHLVPRLAEHFTCHLIDLPGTGQTGSATLAPVTLQDHARTVATVVERLGLTRYGLLAHDSGAVIARLVAARHGDRVRALVMGNTEIPGHRPWLVVMYVWFAKIPGAMRLLQWTLRSAMIRRSFLAFGGCFSDPAAHLKTDFHDLFVAPMLSDDRAFAGQMRLAAGLDFAEIDGLNQTHREITAPVLMVWGQDDPFFPVEQARAMPQQFGGPAHLHELPNARLFAHEDHPRAFLDATVPFLTESLAKR